MANHNPQKIPLAFGDFLAYLSRQGFTIGVDHHLRLQLLLDKIGGQCGPAELKTLLCPIFATDEREQDAFYRAFDEYFEIFAAADRPELAGALETPAQIRKTSSRKSGWRSSLGYTIFTILALALVFFIVQQRQLKEWFGSAAPAPTPSTQPTRQSIEMLRPSGVGFWYERRNPLRLTVVIVPLICFLIYEFVYFRRRKLILDRASGRKPPDTWPIRVHAPEIDDYRSELFYRAARGLRRRQIGDFHRLDPIRTIAATIEARGYPSFRYRPDSRLPEYLILIERASPRDHQALLFDDLTRALEKEGLFVLRYFYAGDPRLCFDEVESRAVHLFDLQKKYPSHRLLIFGNGEKLLDPFSGRLASWTSRILEWPEQVILTPETDWGLREKALTEEFLLLPATLQGLSELPDRFDLPVLPDFDDWNRNGAASPPDPEEPITAEVLRDYLGEESFQWLCACAVYPELHWDLTLFLGSLPEMGESLIDESNLLRLIRLPWFRTGSMPDDLRLELIGELESSRERAIRSAIIEMLEKSPAPPGSFAADARRLEIAVQRGWLSRENHAELDRATDEIGQFPLSEIARDHALVRFLESAPSSRLAMLLPRHLRALFYEKGIPAFGLKTGVRALATLVVIALLLAGLELSLPSLSVRSIELAIAVAILIAVAVVTVLSYWLAETREPAIGRTQKRPQPKEPPQIPIKPLQTEKIVVIEDLGDGVKLEMIYIPGGEFMMGGNEYSSEKPIHRVNVAPFFIGKFQVTQAQWKAVMKGNPSRFKGDDLPVENISWREASEFCRQLTKKTGKAFRLPTESEWEYACRAGSDDRFCFGDDKSMLGQYAWYSQNSGGQTHPVGQKRPNAWVIYDMHGNVWEWCQDQWHGSYEDMPIDSSAWERADYDRQVIRGGSWDYYSESCRSAARSSLPPYARHSIVGLRVVAAVGIPDA